MAEKTRTVLLSPYRIRKPHSPIQLLTDRIDLVYDDRTTVTTTARVEFRFVPAPELFIVASDSDIPLHSITGKKVREVRFPTRRTSIRVMEAAMKTSHIEVIPSKQPVTGLRPGNRRIRKVLFHLLNFPHCWGHTVDYESTPGMSHRLYQNILVAGDWRITVSSQPSTPAALHALKERGGYAITHVGSIESVNGRPISATDARKLLQALHYFFSFARGAWAAPVLAMGIDDAGDRIWEDWGRRNTDRWETVRSWFDGQCGKMLEDAFPGFWKMWNDPLWGNQIRSAIYWYLAGNKSSRGVDAGIILTQASLEPMAFVYLVNYKKMLSNTQFDDTKKYPASKKIEMLMRDIGVPVGISPKLKRLRRRSSTYLWANGPDAFTNLRNSLVHAKKKFIGEKLLVELEYEAWNLGLWYLEMLLLKLFDYSGRYANRLVQQRKLGQLEKVPWA